MEKINNVKNYLYMLFIGFLVGGCLVGGLTYRAGLDGIGRIGVKFQHIAEVNRELTRQLGERDVLHSQLERENLEIRAINRKLEISSERRQGIIDAARAELASAKTSVDKIRAIFVLLKDN
jgi:hypothetical protein